MVSSVQLTLQSPTRPSDLSDLGVASLPQSPALDDQPLYSVPIKKGHSRQKPVASAAAAHSLITEANKPQDSPKKPQDSPKKPPCDNEKNSARLNSATADFLKQEREHEHRNREVNHEDCVNDLARCDSEVMSPVELEVRSASTEVLDKCSPGSLRSDVSRGFESSETLLSTCNSASESQELDHNCDSGIQLDKVGDQHDIKFADEDDETEMKDSGVFLRQVGIGDSRTDLYMDGRLDKDVLCVKQSSRRTLYEISRFSSRLPYIDGTTLIENRRRFLTPLVCAGCLLTGWETTFARAELFRTYTSKLRFILRVGYPHKQVAWENISRSFCI